MRDGVVHPDRDMNSRTVNMGASVLGVAVLS